MENPIGKYKHLFWREKYLMSNVDGTFGSTHLIECTPLIEPPQSVKDCIATAVNYTYGVNINPVKIGELICEIRLLLKVCQDRGFASGYTDCVEEVLNNIKYKE